ncbi:MAG: MoaD/ThiS family protein [Deltaproteobacteria bacterium]|nr:MoaD/ThiS family protein [Deltaproteobacteria bacterium]
MNVQVKLFADLRQYLPGGESPWAGELPEGTTVAKALEKFGVPEGKPRILLVNGRHAQPGQELREGDLLSVFPPVAGG